MNNILKRFLGLLVAIIIIAILLVDCAMGVQKIQKTIQGSLLLPTPLPTTDASVQRYLQSLEIVDDRFSKVWDDMYDLSTMHVITITVDFIGIDLVWKEKALPVLAEALIVHEQIRKLQPPPCFKEHHRLLTNATLYCDDHVYLLIEGINTNDLDIIDQAIYDALPLCSTSVVAANEELSVILNYLAGGGPCVHSTFIWQSGSE